MTDTEKWLAMISSLLILANIWIVQVEANTRIDILIKRIEILEQKGK